LLFGKYLPAPAKIENKVHLWTGHTSNYYIISSGT